MNDFNFLAVENVALGCDPFFGDRINDPRPAEAPVRIEESDDDLGRSGHQFNSILWDFYNQGSV